MQAVILAAGKGTRMKNLTESKPKPLLEISGKTLLEYKFEILPEEVDEIVLIVGYLGGTIHERFGGRWNDKRIFYVEQEVLDGTAGALWKAKDILKDRFVVMMGDDLYAKGDLDRLLALGEWTMLVEKTQHVRSGSVVVDQNGAVQDIEEGEYDKEGLTNTGLFALDARLFEHPLIPKSPGSEEFGLPQTVLAASKASGIPFSAVESTFWFQVTAPEDLKKAEDILQNR